MTETLHNRPVARTKLSAALKRNMARRKAVAGRGARSQEEPSANATRSEGWASQPPDECCSIAFSTENAGSN